MIWKWEIRGDKIYLQVASGSVQNLKPDLVMEAFVRFLEERGDYRGNGGTSPLETGAFGYHRLEMYADMGENGERKLLTLESLGKDMKKTE